MKHAPKLLKASENNMVGGEDDLLLKVKSAIFETRLKDAACLLRHADFERQTQHNYEKALTYYERGLFHVYFDELSFQYELMEKHQTAVRAAQFPLHLGAASCEIDLGQFRSAVKRADIAIGIDPASARALYVRACAHLKCDDLDATAADIKAAYGILVHGTANTNEFGQKLQELRRELQSARVASRARRKKMWGGKLRQSRPKDAPQLAAGASPSSATGSWPLPCFPQRKGVRMLAAAGLVVAVSALIQMYIG